MKLRGYTMLRALAATGVLGLTLAGCGGDTPETTTPAPTQATGTAPAGGAATGSPATGAPATDAANAAQVPIIAGGVGPYRTGVTVDTDLKPGNLIGDVTESTACKGWSVAPATAPYAQGVTVLIKDGKVSWVEVRKPGVTTPEGATIGTTVAALRAYYEARGGKEIGRAQAYSVPDGTGQGLLFRLDNKGIVTQIDAGEAKTLETRVTEAAPRC